MSAAPGKRGNHVDFDFSDYPTLIGTYAVSAPQSYIFRVAVIFVIKSKEWQPRRRTYDEMMGNGMLGWLVRVHGLFA